MMVFAYMFVWMLLSTPAWPWLSVKRILTTKDRLVCFEKFNFLKKNSSSRSFFRNCCSSTSWSGNSSARKVLNFEAARSHFLRVHEVYLFKSLKRSFHRSCCFSVGTLERWDRSKILEQRRIVDSRGHPSKNFCNIPLMNSWAPCLNFFTPSLDTLSDWANFLIAPFTSKPTFILFRGNKVSWSDKSILINFFVLLHDSITDDLTMTSRRLVTIS